MSKWTDSEIALFATLTDSVIAERLNRNLNTVRGARQRFKAAGRIPSNPAKTPESQYDVDLERANNSLWQKKYKQLASKYEKAINEAALVQQLVSEIRELAPIAYSPLPAVYPELPRSGGTPQSGLLLLSDTHVGKVVRPDQTHGLGQYDFDTFLWRLKYLESSTLSIIKNHMPYGVDELVIAMLGDMLDGALHHAAESGQPNPLFNQFYGASHALAQFIRNVAPHVPRIHIPTCVGNHTRWQNQKKMPTDNRFSNLDQFLYAMVQALTRDIPNVSWTLDMQPTAIFEIKGFQIKAFHGDSLRGGDKALGLPNHALGREISINTQLAAKNGRPAINYYVCGHLHRSFTVPHALGNIIINGGFPGLDNYALHENFNPTDPTQHLMFLHPKYGRTASYDLSLKFANVVYGDYPYDIPKTFPII